MKMRFESIFAFAVMGVLFLALVGAFWKGNTDLINIIVTVFISSLSAITAFFFTKHKPDKPDDEQ